MTAGELATAVVLGVGATLAMDLWNLALLRFFGIPSLNYAYLGRWILNMPAGSFRHERIAAAPAKRYERAAGYLAHYSIGVFLAVGFVAVAGPGWIAAPTLLPALLFGLGSVVLPFFVLQPALGLGIASAKAPRPLAARCKSLATHTVFGLALYACARALATTVVG